MRWTQSLREAMDHEIVAIDGKALRHAREAGGDVRYMVNAWAGSNRLILGQFKAPAITFGSLETADKGHGRLEIRRYYQSTDLGWFADLGEWEGLKSVGMVESIREIKGVQSIERRYDLISPSRVRPCHHRRTPP